MIRNTTTDTTSHARITYLRLFALSQREAWHTTGSRNDRREYGRALVAYARYSNRYADLEYGYRLLNDNLWTD